VPSVEFRVLGALEAGAAGVVADLGPPKQRALLAILVLHAGEIVSIDRLTDLLWGDAPPRTAAHSIRIYVSELRKALEPLAGRRLINTRPPGYQLEVTTDEVDARRFEQLVAEGMGSIESGDRPTAIAALRSALELWRGPALSDFAYEEFAQPYVQRFHDLHLDAVETLASAELEAGRTSAVIPLLEAAIRDDPLRERSRELLMLALYRSGRHPEALRTYDTFREHLVEELGLEPSPPLQRLRDQVLLHDPILAPAASDAAADDQPARNPYKGLKAFAEQDADDFYGREALVTRLVEMLATGQRLIALVGPSGSGKSSVVAAGLLPRLRTESVGQSDNWVIVPITLGPDPAADARAAVIRATQRAVPSDRLVPPGVEGERLLLVLDQFEQLFTTGDEARRTAFLSTLVAELNDPASPMAVVLTLRADYYDRPLQHPEFSAAFVPGVVHVLPLAARELEAAIVAPAAGVGVRVEPALLAELVAETVASPGSLPLLQYALTELFDQRAGTAVTLAAYTELGGLRGILSRRAEAAYVGLDADGQRVATQVFLRLVRLGQGSADSRRRLTLAELTEVSTDAVVLSDVLTTFGRHRLLTFDHDSESGEATVELAHEALLTEWERLAEWIDRYRSALRRRDALLAAVDEWELSGRDDEYLLGGRRLAELDAWSQEGTLRLTTREREFLDAGLDRERTTAEADAARAADHQRIAKSARRRLIGLAAAAAVLVSAGVVWLVTVPAAGPRPAAMAFTDDGLATARLTAGFDRAVRDHELTSRKYSWDGVYQALDTEHGAGWEEGLTEQEFFELVNGEAGRQFRAAAADAGIVVTMGLWPSLVEDVAAEFPDVQFIADVPIDRPNVTLLRFDDSQASYLAGAAAAHASRRDTIGFIGGADDETVWAFQAGFEAGAKAINPDIEILSHYLGEAGSFIGFNAPDLARSAAEDMYDAGADVVMHAAGNSGLGLFEAAKDFSQASGYQVWAIGAETDQYRTIGDLPLVENAASLQPYILTSATKGIDTIVERAIAAYATGSFEPGTWTWGLEEGASGISYSGGYLDPYRNRLEALRAEIIAGEIVVPCVPEDRLTEAEDREIAVDFCRDGAEPPS